MYVSRLILCFLIIYDFSEGRKVQGIIGRNLSFSWTFNYIRKDAIQITHNATLLLRVWPANSYLELYAQTDRVRAMVTTSTEGTVTVTLNYLNITNSDSGIYKVIREYNSEEFKDSILLETTEGRKVQGIIGRNLSFSWTFNYIWKDAIQITHNESRLLRVWPANSYLELYAQTDRVRAMVTTSTEGTVTVTLNYLNITNSDSGIYKVIREYNSEEFNDSILLETIEITPYTTMPTPQEDTDGINIFSTASLNRKKESEGKDLHTTTITTSEMNAEGFSSKHHLQFIVLGMGVIIILGFLACLLNKLRICFCADGEGSRNTFANSHMDDMGRSLPEATPPGNYWSIVSNANGDMCTAIETDFEAGTGTSLIERIIRPTPNESKYSIIPDGHVNVNLDEYLNPIHSRFVELEHYLHPIHTSSVNTSFVTTRHSSEF